MIMEKDCNNCKFELYNADEIPCNDCGMDNREYWQPKPQTNGDRIRAMSDEELADLAFKLNVDEQVNFCKMLPECEEILDRDEDLDLNKCKGCFVQWLKEPYKEDD